MTMKPMILAVLAILALTSGNVALADSEGGMSTVHKPERTFRASTLTEAPAEAVLADR